MEASKDVVVYIVLAVGFGLVVHRGEIIQLHAVIRVDALFHGDAVAEFDDGSSVAVSRTHRDAFFARWRGR
jgi:DNA-binding LytR/AlgR family response regulator